MGIFQDFPFSVIHILREINFEDSRSPKNVIFAILGAIDCINVVKFSLENCKNPLKSKFRVSECVEMADFVILESPRLISRKICVVEKS